MQELIQKYHSLYIRILSRYLNTCVTERIYKLSEYLFKPYLKQLEYVTKDHIAMQTIFFKFKKLAL